MKNIKKNITFILLFTAIFSANTSVFAQEFALLPKANKNKNECASLMKSFHMNYQTKKDLKYNSYARFNAALEGLEIDAPLDKEMTILGCGVVTGRIRFYFWKPYVAFLIKNLSILAGVLSMLFITLGGYQYFLAMVSGEDSNAKNTVKNAILGLVISFSSWLIVEIVQSFVSY